MTSDDAPTIFREVLSNLAASVTVITISVSSTEHYGLTVSSFCSVSLDPPLVLFCIDKASNSLGPLQKSQSFTVNILKEGTDNLAMSFASKDEDKFALLSGTARTSSCGPILVDHTVAYLLCDVEDQIEAGDHWIVIGRVVGGDVLDESEPLVYHRRSFRSMQE